MAEHVAVHSLRRLAPRERQVAETVIALGEAGASEVADRLPVPLSNSAVRSMLSRLEAKRFIRKRVEGNRYLYRAAVSDEAVRAAALLRVSQDHFDGSLAAVADELQRRISAR